MGVIQFCPKIMTFWKRGLCLMLIIIGIISIMGSPIPEDNTEMSGDEGGSGNGNGSGEDEPVAEAVRQENGEQGKNKKEPTMEELMDALDDLEEGGSKGFRSLTAGQGPEADAVKQEAPVEDEVEEGGDDEVEDEDAADDEDEGADDEEQNYPEDDTEGNEECDEEDCKEEQQPEVDEDVNAPESEAVKQEEPSQDKPEAESVMDGQGKGMTLENMIAKLDAMDNDAPGTNSKSQAGVNGEVDEKQKELDKVFGGGGDGGDIDEDLPTFGTKNAKQKPELDLMAEDEKEDEMAQNIENMEDEDEANTILPNDGSVGTGGNPDKVLGAADSLPPEVTWKIIQMMKMAAKYRQQSESIFLAVGKILAQNGFTGQYRPERHNLVKESDLSSDLLPPALKNFWEGSKADI